MPQILKHIARFICCMCVLMMGAHPFSVYAQENVVNKLKSKADAALKQGDTYSALDCYEAMVRNEPDNYTILYRLGELQMETRNYAKAQQTFKMLLEKRPALYPLAKYYYGVMCKRVGEYETAFKVLSEFQNEYKGKDARTFKTKAAREAEGAKLAMTLLHQKSRYQVAHPGKEMNSGYTEFSPMQVSDSTMIYAALKSDIIIEIDADSPKNFGGARFYTAAKSDSTWTTTGELAGPFNKTNDEKGNGSYSADGQRFYFTRCKVNQENKMVCQLYLSTLLSNGWTKPKKADAMINEKGCTTTQPFVTKGKNNSDLVYFVSDRAQGQGGLDIWMAQYNPAVKKWNAPKNLGKRVNTDADEMTPFYDKAGGALYFSSDGWPSVGGLDIFKVKGEEGKFKSFPENLGFPVNSAADDMYYSLNEHTDEGFIVSNRTGSVWVKNPNCCDDIFQIKLDRTLQFAVHGAVAYKEDKGSNNQQLADATVRLFMAESDIPVGEVNTDASGNFLLELNPESDYYITINQPDFLGYRSDMISTKGLHTSDTLSAPEMILSRVSKQPIKIENIYYEFDSAGLTQNSKVVLDTTVYRILVANPQIILEIGSHTDSRGADAYNLYLSQGRAQSVVNYLIEKGIDQKRLQAKGYGATAPVAPNTNPDGSDNPEGRSLNRRTEFKIIGELEENPDDISIYPEFEER